MTKGHAPERLVFIHRHIIRAFPSTDYRFIWSTSIWIVRCAVEELLKSLAPRWKLKSAALGNMALLEKFAHECFVLEIVVAVLYGIVETHLRFSCGNRVNFLSVALEM